MLETGFILLTNEQFDVDELLNTLKVQWHISAENIEAKNETLVFSVGDFLCSLAVMPAPVPNSEAVHRAQGNYYCPDAVTIAKAHQAHLMLTVINQTQDAEIEGMKLYSKIAACCLRQANATGIYTSGTVFSADFYYKVCEQYLHGDDIPLMVWVFVGMGQNENGNQLYTVGMEKFQKEEMEINNSQVDMQTLHTSLLSMCDYIITSGLILKDGETIGFSAEQKWAISRSKSVYAPSEYSLKINII